MSVIVNGESSGGKSFLLKETLKTLPEEATHVLQSVSDKALAYIADSSPIHRPMISCSGT